tara:strand:+ start:166 stop:393 length:228 start_codon:yes stop_codon:yes gene_type:complete
MSLQYSIKRQKDIEDVKKAIAAAFNDNVVSDLVVLKFPRWSIYYSDGTSSQSFDFNAIDAGIIHKLLRVNYIEKQ